MIGGILTPASGDDTQAKQGTCNDEKGEKDNLRAMFWASSTHVHRDDTAVTKSGTMPQ